MRSGRALYFSRAPIPWNRDGAAGGARQSARLRRRAAPHRHLRLSRAARCCELAQLPPGALEVREKLEQLRALEHGMTIQVADALERPGPDVNTLADLERVSALMARRRADALEFDLRRGRARAPHSQLLTTRLPAGSARPELGGTSAAGASNW